MSIEELCEVLSDYAQGQEALAVKLKLDVAALAQRKESQPELDFNNLLWEEKQGKNAPFQQTNEKANNNSPLWQALKAKLNKNKGFCQHNGFKYWFNMQNEMVVDRRKTE